VNRGPGEIKDTREIPANKVYKANQALRVNKEFKDQKDHPPHSEMTQIENKTQNQVVSFIQQIAVEQQGGFHCLLLDSPPGTGKSTCIKKVQDALQSLSLKTLVLVYSNNLRADFAKDNIDSCTCCKFVMTQCRLSFEQVVKEFFEEEETLDRTLYKFYREVFTVDDAVHFDILVLDEYTTVSVWLIWFLFFFCKRQKKILLFCGDRNQQKSIQTSKLLNFNNFDVVSKLCEKSFCLTESFRIKDQVYLNKLDLFKTKFCGQGSMNLAAKYFLYEWLPHCFVTPQSETAIFLASYHSQILSRLRQFDHFQLPYELNGAAVSLDHKASLGYIPCQLGWVYQVRDYDDKPDEVMFGVLENVDNDNLEFSVLGQSKKVVCHKRPISDVKSFNYIFKDCFPDTFQSVTQFDCKPAALTYHQIQGLTLPETVKLDLNIDAMNPNAVYVGLSRIRKVSQLNSFVSQDADLLKFNYKLRNSSSYLFNCKLRESKNVRFFDCRNVEEFTVTKHMPKKIHRCLLVDMPDVVNHPELDFIEYAKQLELDNCLSFRSFVDLLRRQRKQ
jgi:hypothetical protein